MMLYAAKAAAEMAAERLKIYAQPQRLMILSRLLGGEHTVGEIEASTGIVQPALSQQLAALRRAEVVRTRRLSKQVFYALANANVVACVQAIEAMFGAPGGISAAPSDVATGARRPPSIGRPHAAAAFARVDPPKG